MPWVADYPERVKTAVLDNMPEEKTLLAAIDRNETVAWEMLVDINMKWSDLFKDLLMSRAGEPQVPLSIPECFSKHFPKNETILTRLIDKGFEREEQIDILWSASQALSRALRAASLAQQVVPAG